MRSDDPPKGRLAEGDFRVAAGGTTFLSASAALLARLERAIAELAHE